MKLAAIYNVWDGEELLPASILSIREHVDLIIIVYQDVSNFGEKHNPLDYLPEWMFLADDIIFDKFKPRIMTDAKRNEVLKRNNGIELALEYDCTHFLHMDCDEIYQDFDEAKEFYINSGHAGSVCKLHTYFKRPTLRLETPEDYYVPFIHVLRQDTIAGGNVYPFYVDPTRRINEMDIIELPVFMHHYSWVRNNIMRKVNNSTARKGLMKGKHIKDYQRVLKAGDYIECYERKLIEVEDYFNLNSVIK